MLEKTLESPLDYKEIKPVHPKGNQSWIFIGRTDAEAAIPIFGHLMWRTDAFELWCWRGLLWVPWTARRSSQSILKEISPEYSLEGLMLNLKVQYFGHLMRRAESLERPWCWERLKAEGEEDNRGWDGWMASSTQWTPVWVSSGSWLWTGKPGVLQSMGSQRVGHY